MKKFTRPGSLYLVLIILIAIALILAVYFGANFILVSVVALILIIVSAITFGIRASIPGLIVSSACLLHYFYQFSECANFSGKIIILLNYFIIAISLGIARDFFQKQKKNICLLYTSRCV